MTRHPSRSGAGAWCAASQGGFCERLRAAGFRDPCTAVERRHFAAGARIVPGEAGPGIAHVLRAGIVTMAQVFSDGRRQILEMLFPGDMLMATTRSGAEARIAEAQGSVTLCSIRVSELLPGADAGSGREALLIAAAFDEVERKNRQCLVLGRMRSEERVASFLLDYEARSRPAAGRVTLAVSRADIADFLCLTRETVSRCFTLLRRHGLIALNASDEIEMRDREGLERLARGDGLAPMA